MAALLLWIWLMISNPPEFRARLAGQGVTAAPGAPIVYTNATPVPVPVPRPYRPC